MINCKHFHANTLPNNCCVIFDIQILLIDSVGSDNTVSNSRKYDPRPTIEKTHSSLGLSLSEHVFFSILLINHSPFIPQLASRSLHSHSTRFVIHSP